MTKAASVNNGTHRAQRWTVPGRCVQKMGSIVHGRRLGWRCFRHPLTKEAAARRAPLLHERSEVFVCSKPELACPGPARAARKFSSQPSVLSRTALVRIISDAGYCLRGFCRRINGQADHLAQHVAA